MQAVEQKHISNSLPLSTAVQIETSVLRP